MRKIVLSLCVLSAAACLLQPLPLYTAAEQSEDIAVESENTAEPQTEGDYKYLPDEANGGVLLYYYTGTDTAELTIPETLGGLPVTSLGGGAFVNHTELTHVTLPASLVDFEDSVFYGCSSLKGFEVGQNEHYRNIDGVLFTADGSSLVCYPPALSGETSYTVPEGTQEIRSAAFMLTPITQVTLPSSLLYIDEWAFSGTGLSTITLNEGLLIIGMDAFSHCTGLKKVIFPSTLEKIEAEAFGGCTNLEEIELNDGLREVQMNAFAGTAMKSVTIPASVQEIGYCAFGYQADTVTQVPGFVIYGEVGSRAQMYATDSDDEWDYENNFTFISASLNEESSTGAEESSAAPSKVRESRDSAFKSVGRWVLIGAGVLVLLIGGLVLVFGGKKTAGRETAEQAPSGEKKPAGIKSEENTGDEEASGKTESTEKEPEAED